MEKKWGDMPSATLRYWHNNNLIHSPQINECNPALCYVLLTLIFCSSDI